MNVQHARVLTTQGTFTVLGAANEQDDKRVKLADAPEKLIHDVSAIIGKGGMLWATHCGKSPAWAAINPDHVVGITCHPFD
jgi:hypothetical protein